MNLHVSAVEVMHYRNNRKSDENDVAADIARIYGCYPLNGVSSNFQDLLCTLFDAGVIHGKRAERRKRKPAR